MVKTSDRGWSVMSSRPLPLKTRRVRERYDSLRCRAIGRLEASQSEAEVAESLQVAQKWSPGHGINSKQVYVTRKVSQGRHRASTSAHDRYLA
ncbi:hypothetical protein TNCV_4732321 [Trichonephila clavipes]|nr:hypothetical protein TNCV_4732321 [Trichonephila clavipes]